MFVNRSTSDPNDLIYNVQVRVLSSGINISFSSKYKVNDPVVTGNLYLFNVDHYDEIGVREYNYDLNAIDNSLTVEFVDGDKKRRRPKIIIHL